MMEDFLRRRLSLDVISNLLSDILVALGRVLFLLLLVVLGMLLMGRRADLEDWISQLRTMIFIDASSLEPPHFRQAGPTHWDIVQTHYPGIEATPDDYPPVRGCQISVCSGRPEPVGCSWPGAPSPSIALLSSFHQNSRLATVDSSPATGNLTSGPGSGCSPQPATGDVGLLNTVDLSCYHFDRHAHPDTYLPLRLA